MSGGSQSLCPVVVFLFVKSWSFSGHLVYYCSQWWSVYTVYPDVMLLYILNSFYFYKKWHWNNTLFYLFLIHCINYISETLMLVFIKERVFSTFKSQHWSFILVHLHQNSKSYHSISYFVCVSIFEVKCWHCAFKVKSNFCAYLSFAIVLIM